MFILLGAFVLIGGGAFVSLRQPQRLPQYVSEVGHHLKFERVAAPGFDAQGRGSLADSAWSMRYFRADGDPTGYLYVGTD